MADTVGSFSDKSTLIRKGTWTWTANKMSMTQFVTMELPMKSQGSHGRTTRERVRVTSYYSPETAEKFKRLRELYPNYCKSAVIDMALKEWFEKHWDEIELSALVFVPVVAHDEDGKEITYMAYIEYAKELGVIPNE